MNRTFPLGSDSFLFVEALEPRIAPAGLLNEAKFTSITAGGSVLLDATDPNGFQGISTGFGANSGSYLLYITAGKALVFTSDLNGNGKVDSNEITGIAAGVDSNGHGLDLISFTNINGDIATNLLPGVGVSALTDSDNNPNNGRDGRVLLDNGIHSITLRTLTASDIDTTIPGNTVANRLALTSFSIFGNIYTGGDFGAAGAGLTIDTSGEQQLFSKFSGVSGANLYTGSTPDIGSIKTGTAASYQHFHFGESSSVDIQGTFLPFKPSVGEHGGDITGIKATTAAQVFNIGSMETGAGGVSARGGNLSEITLHGDTGTYQLVAGDGGQGGSGGVGGSVIGFNDLGTVSSSVLIHTGAGGIGLLGAGGKAGTATFTGAAISANVVVVLGDGGNGFTAGGDGASQSTASFLPPEGNVPVGGKVIGTYHEPGDIGTLRYTGTDAAGNATYAARAIDFDGDGFGDVVYTSRSPDQIVVLFGDGTGGFDTSKTLFLNAPGVSLNTVAVGDFNGDGRPDIVAASGNGNNFGGISLFLNQMGDPLRNPLGGKNYTHNVLGNHPFSDALQSALPTLSDFGFLQGRNPVLGITAGDYNGDGIMDVAITDNLSYITLSGLMTDQLVTVLFGDDVRNPNTGLPVADPNTGRPQGSGFFVANTAPVGQPAFLSFADVASPAKTGKVLMASSNEAVNSGAPDVFFYLTRGAGAVSEFYVPTDAVTHQTFGLGGGGGAALGKVDTNRAAQVALQDAKVQDFSLTDLNADGVLDLVALTSQPVGFLVTFKGATPNATNTAAFSLTVASGVGNNSGAFYGGGNTEPLAITTIDFNPDGTQDGIFNQFAAESLAGDPRTASIQEFSLATNGTPDFHPADNSFGGARAAASIGLAADDAVTGLDAYYPVVGIRNSAVFPLSDRPVSGYGLLDTNTSDTRFAQIEFFAPFGASLLETNIFYLTQNGIHLFAGNGGNSTAGAAGNGGTLGTGLNAGADGDAAGSIAIVFPAYLSYNGSVGLIGGNGGNGFGGGGNGGDVTGISTRTAGTVISTPVTLNAGNGGNGISGDGGRGGDLSALTILTNSAFFTAGNAGTGLHGGRGGSILGNQTAGVFYDVNSISVTAVAGTGGTGALGGGAGGSISNFTGTFTNAIGGSGGSLIYSSGAGGSAAAGIGGNGGGITDSSPDVNGDAIAEVLLLSTGFGGSGLSGGDGGVISNFFNRATDPTAIPYQMAILTGHGGIGVVGAGGAGGAINNFQSNAAGLTAQIFGSPDLVRIVAGAGGASYAGTGGAGGSITNGTSQAVSSPLVVLAGAGGAGVTGGGAGGSVGNSVFNSASQILGKVLIVAGAGGDATAVSAADVFIPNDPDITDLAHSLLSFGGVSGIGGNGGNITNITQPISVQTAVDLIAGNGGSTINYGSSISASSGVGTGGSVENVNLAGTVGDSVRSPTTGVNPPIRSYTDANGSTSLAVLAQSLGGVIDPFFGFIPAANYNAAAFATPVSALTSSLGNVGIVAGISGRVLGGAPPLGGVNGSVKNIAASSFMSVIAGSVDSVAPAASISGLTLKNLDGVFGADKSATTVGDPNNVVEYFDPTSGRVVSNLQPGYQLIDGAIYAQNIVQPAVPPNIKGPRVFAVS